MAIGNKVKNLDCKKDNVFYIFQKNLNRWTLYPMSYVDYYPKLPWIAARKMLY